MYIWYPDFCSNVKRSDLLGCPWKHLLLSQGMSNSDELGMSMYSYDEPWPPAVTRKQVVINVINTLVFAKLRRQMRFSCILGLQELLIPVENVLGHPRQGSMSTGNIPMSTVQTSNRAAEFCSLSHCGSTDYSLWTRNVKQSAMLCDSATSSACQTKGYLSGHDERMVCRFDVYFILAPFTNTVFLIT